MPLEIKKDVKRAKYLDYFAAAAVAVSPTASAYFKYVSTEATTTLASMARSSIPTRETRTHASTTTPLSRMRSMTSTKLELDMLFSTAMLEVVKEYIKNYYSGLFSFCREDDNDKMTE